MFVPKHLNNLNTWYLSTLKNSKMRILIDFLPKEKVRVSIIDELFSIMRYRFEYKIV